MRCWPAGCDEDKVLETAEGGFVTDNYFKNSGAKPKVASLTECWKACEAYRGPQLCRSTALKLNADGTDATCYMYDKAGPDAIHDWNGWTIMSCTEGVHPILPLTFVCRFIEVAGASSLVRLASAAMCMAPTMQVHLEDVNGVRLHTS